MINKCEFFILGNEVTVVFGDGGMLLTSDTVEDLFKTASRPELLSLVKNLLDAIEARKESDKLPG